MKTIIYFTSLIIIGSALSCGSAREAKNKSKEASTIAAAELVENIDDIRSTGSHQILNVSLTANIMTLKVQYSGGCENHEFKLYGSTFIQKSLPPKRGVKLFHNSNNDSCRELIEQDIQFDISNLAYESGEIILVLEGWEPLISYTKQ